ncbi:hypothetical protein HK100_006558 [Physocladia obscura]|uniref:Uncharacterized protein n=1 Tax=Physocladia obscura TaxID=109957 RepID=A0AAD5X8R0_9FUNG|nr:hypothetical protein HK100_006558 [Physocladia obscura]
METNSTLDSLIHARSLTPLLRLLLLQQKQQDTPVEYSHFRNTLTTAVDLFVNRSNIFKKEKLRARFSQAWRAVSAVYLIPSSDYIDNDEDHSENLGLDSDLLLQTALIHVHLSLFQEAFDLLERFVVLTPYSEDPILLGHSGLISFLLWTRETEAFKSDNNIFSASYDDDTDSTFPAI